MRVGREKGLFCEKFGGGATPHLEPGATLPPPPYQFTRFLILHEREPQTKAHKQKEPHKITPVKIQQQQPPILFDDLKTAEKKRSFIYYLLLYSILFYIVL